MKKILYLFAFSVLAFGLSGCDNDDMEGPDAQVYGEIFDKDTGDLIEQDIMQGSKIYYIEKGWENPPEQIMRFHSDGTYRNNLMFSGEYEFRLIRGNYVPLTPFNQTIKKGKNVVDFEVLPYIRIKNPNIVINGNVVTATFKVEQAAPGYKVKELGLFAHTDNTVSQSISIASYKKPMNSDISPSSLQTLQLTINASDFNLRKFVYFRIGALSAAPEARYNYAPCVELELP